MSYLSEVEKGKKQASEDILGAITPWYNITVPELLRETADRLEVNVNAG
jgi:transcriptional regulator with XRE-family HTH domain